jgi:hypothetical protein
MTFRHVPLVYLCQAMMGWIPYSSAYCQARVGSCCYILLDQKLKTNPTQVPKWVMLIRSGELPGMSDRRPESLSRDAEKQQVR